MLKIIEIKVNTKIKKVNFSTMYYSFEAQKMMFFHDTFLDRKEHLQLTHLVVDQSLFEFLFSYN